MPYKQDYTSEQGRRQLAFNLLPAVAIGGPPHAGKSVLAYSLTKALRARGVDHYLLRAYPPDGEGDWFLQGEPSSVRHFRIKGAESEKWLPLLKRDIAQRHLPLILDMGGLPTLEQEGVLDTCTHAILLTRDSDSHSEWQVRMARHGLVIVADLQSDLCGTNELIATGPPIIGRMTQLERGSRASGPAFDALVALLGARFAESTVGLRRQHLSFAPVDLAVDLRQLAIRLSSNPIVWSPEDLQPILTYLPQGQPIGLYGRGPNWLYAAVAVHARPSDFFLFDVRWGWIAPPSLRNGQTADSSPWELAIRHHGRVTTWSFRLPAAYLDLMEAEDANVPAWPANSGVILSGKLPHWLISALARAYEGPWLAILQPHLEGAVVVCSRVSTHIPGDLIPVPGPHSDPARFVYPEH